VAEVAGPARFEEEDGQGHGQSSGNRVQVRETAFGRAEAR